MKVNTIILIDERKKKKQIFIDKLKKEIEFSYTKLEGLLKTLIETFPEKYAKDKKENLYEFLVCFLKKLDEKEGIFLIDIDALSIENVKKVIEKNKNMIVIYLRKKENNENILSTDIEQMEDVELLIKEIQRKIR